MRSVNFRPTDSIKVEVFKRTMAVVVRVPGLNRPVRVSFKRPF